MGKRGGHVIDAQVHAYERDHPGRPWARPLHGPREVTGEQLVAAMDAVGVDAGILVSPWTLYDYDASYAIAVRNRFPDRFALVKPVDPKDPAVADTIAEWADTPGAVAVRLMLFGDATHDAADPGLDRVLGAAARHGLPVNLYAWGRLGQVAQMAQRHPDTRIVLDHVGLPQPFEPPPPEHPFAGLDELLALARLPNLVLKLTGICTMSREPFPYADLWDPMARIFDAFGIERCLWGTDWTRATGLLSYAQGVDAFRVADRISDEERAALMGGNAMRVYGWSPRQAAGN